MRRSWLYPGRCVVWKGLVWSCHVYLFVLLVSFPVPSRLSNCFLSQGLKALMRISHQEQTALVLIMSLLHGPQKRNYWGLQSSHTYHVNCVAHLSLPSGATASLRGVYKQQTSMMLIIVTYSAHKGWKRCGEYVYLAKFSDIWVHNLFAKCLRFMMTVWLGFQLLL
ncbi:hypothetical protein HDK77DRAFT_433836 [Phyllosticta capitalensis]